MSQNESYLIFKVSVEVVGPMGMYLVPMSSIDTVVMSQTSLSPQIEVANSTMPRTPKSPKVPTFYIIALFVKTELVHLKANMAWVCHLRTLR